MHIMRMAAWLVVAMAALPSRALAQPTTSWDGGASFGFVWGDGLAPHREPYGDDGPNVAYNLDIGRYWGAHFKTDVGVLLTPERQLYEYEPFPVAGLVGGYSYTQNDQLLSAVSAAATYQFFENDFMHPYVSAGTQVAWVREHRHRGTQGYSVNRIPYTVPALDERSTETLVRPFLAAGCKSYFNERAFIRSEFMTAVDRSGFSHATLRLGFGVDF